MSWLEALVLGIVQGLTEFLPVSSSGHLEIGQALLGTSGEENLTFAINSTIYYHVSAREGDILHAEGRIVCGHHRIPTAEVIVSNQEGVHIATFTGQAYTGRIPHSYDSLQ